MSGSYSSGFASAFDTVSTGPPAAWVPGDPWPPVYPTSTVTPGGVARVEWGGYIRFWLLASIAAGTPLVYGPDAADRYDAGNVYSDASVMAAALPGTTGLWVDLTCDLVSVEWSAGSGSQHGVLSAAEASTLRATLFDPTGKYDPLNPDSPYALTHTSRLVPGRDIVAFCEVVRDPSDPSPSTRQVRLFTGTSDEWSEEWVGEPGDRRAVLTASDQVKIMVKLDRPEQPAVGAGDQILNRLNRILTYFGLPNTAALGAETSRTLQATTLAQPCWEQLSRTVQDDLGFLYVYGDGNLIYLPFTQWTVADDPLSFNIGCGGEGFWDIALDAKPSAFDANVLNTVYATRTGGTEQSAVNAGSVGAFGERSYRRTDLGLQTDAQAGQWATDLVTIQAYPRQAVDVLTMRPALAPDSWTIYPDLLRATLIRPVHRVVYAPPRFDYTVDVRVRTVGYTNRVTPRAWEVEWRTVSTNITPGLVFAYGPGVPTDVYDAGYLYG